MNIGTKITQIFIQMVYIYVKKLRNFISHTVTPISLKDASGRVFYHVYNWMIRVHQHTSCGTIINVTSIYLQKGVIIRRCYINPDKYINSVCSEVIYYQPAILWARRWKAVAFHRFYGESPHYTLDIVPNCSILESCDPNDIMNDVIHMHLILLLPKNRI